MARLSAARRAAFQALERVRQRNAFASLALDSVLASVNLDKADANFARLLCTGVVATQGTLDEAIDRVLSSPGDVKPDVRTALRIATYELLFLGKEPHVAVSQGVEAARFTAPRAGGLANFALRRIAEDAAEFPFGDPSTDDEALARSNGFPLWMARRLIDQMGRAQASEFMRACNDSAPVHLAVNECKDSFESVCAELDLAGCAWSPVRCGADGQLVDGCLNIREGSALDEWPLSSMLEEGRVFACDASSQAVALLCVQATLASAAVDQVRFLEIGSGRGTKTALLQAHAKRLLGYPMHMTCVDKHGFKGDVLARRAKLLGFPLDAIVQADARDLGDHLGEARFHGCLVDAPCSGLGTLRRHPEIRWRLQPGDVNALAETSLALLTEAARFIEPGGVLAYATCTPLQEEDEQVVDAFLSSEAGSCFDIVAVSLEGARKLFFKPQLAKGAPDAHFACIMRRSKALQ